MKRYILVLLLLLNTTSCVWVAPRAIPDRIRYYNKDGTYIGQCYDYGHTKRFYDKKGKFIMRGLK